MQDETNRDMIEPDAADAQRSPDVPGREGGLRKPPAQLFHAIFDRAFQFMGVLSPDGIVLDANQAALDFAAVTRDVVLGVPFPDTVWWIDQPEPERDRLRDAIRRAAAGEFVRYEITPQSAQGETAIVDFSLQPFFGQHGGVVLLIAEGRDITKIKEAERRLRLSEEKYKGMVDIASDAIISTDLGQRIVLYNKGAEAIFGYPPEEVLGQPIGMLIPERVRARHREFVRQFGDSTVAARRMGERSEIVGVRRDGQEFPAEASISKIEVEGERIYTVVLRDITRRRQREMAQSFLAEASNLLAETLDLGTTLRRITDLAVTFFADYCVILERTSDGGLRRVEAAHADATEVDLVDRLRMYRVDPGSRHPANAAIEAGSCVVIEDSAELGSAQGEDEDSAVLRELGVRSAIFAPLRAHGSIWGVIGFLSGRATGGYGEDDIQFAEELAMRASLAMHNARLYEEAQRAVQARDDILAVVSHDLGNPLAAIRIGAGLLLKALPTGEAEGGWKHIENIRHSIQQMERLIKDLLEVKRVEAGKLEMQWERISPSRLIADTVDAMAPLAAERSITLSGSVDDDLPAVRADRERIMQVFWNLVGNAIKFTPEGGRVQVRAERDTADIVFSVTDTGAGIGPDSIEHVFDRFWQAHRNKREGIGLGLAIVAGIVEAHGGRVWVESELGTGSTFYFALPATGYHSAG